MLTNILPDASQRDQLVAQQILSWPDRLFEGLADRLLAMHYGSRLGFAELRDLRDCGIVEDQVPTELGRLLMDLMVHEHWQEGDELDGFLRMGEDHLHGAVLDVGCSTGGVLRGLAAARPRRAIGIDTDLPALALGHRLAQQRGRQIDFICCSAHRLPLPPDSFDWVICRNAVTYMHHRTAIAEMTRVLKPDGLLFIRFESIWYDLSRLANPGSLRGVCCRLRDLCVGISQALLGAQPMPGGALGGGRAFGHPGRIRMILRHHGCEVLRTEEASRSPPFRGHPTQLSLLARKPKLRGVVQVAGIRALRAIGACIWVVFASFPD